jgi:hypothetical protein
MLRKVCEQIRLHGYKSVVEAQISMEPNRAPPIAPSIRLNRDTKPRFCIDP